MGTYSKKSNNSSLTSYSMDGKKEQALRKKLDDDLCLFCNKEGLFNPKKRIKKNQRNQSKKRNFGRIRP
jgi:hypothetical protein